MTSDSDTVNRSTKWMRWIARIWSSPIILYSLIMLIGYAWNCVTIGKADPYTVEGYPLIEALPPILMFLSVFGLGIAWHWEGTEPLRFMVVKAPRPTRKTVFIGN